MVKFIVILSLILFPLVISAGDQLQLIASKTNVEIGMPIRINIIAKNINKNISKINLEALKNNFGLDIIESSNKQDNNTLTQELKIDLYPRQIGINIIPSITLQKSKTLPIEIVVSETAINDDALSIESSYSASSVWQRQQVIITTAITTSSKFSRIELEPFEQSSLETYAIKPTREKLSNGLYKLTASWHVYPLNSGIRLLTPPAINYRLNGIIQRRFFPSANTINIKKLPSYIPPLMPVGNLKVSDNLLAGNIWNIDFSSPDISPTTLSSLSTVLEKNTNITFSEISVKKLSDTSFSHIISLGFYSSGIYTLPIQTYKSFNPVTGKITTHRTAEKKIIYLNTWLKVLIALLSILLIIKLIFIFFKIINKFIVREKNKRIIARSILDAKTPQELHAILNKYAKNQDWGNNLRLNQWSYYWGKHKNASAEDIVNELSLACYSGEFNSLEQNTLNKKIYDFIKK